MHLLGFIIRKEITERVESLNISFYELLKESSKIFAAFIFGKVSRL